MKMDDLDRFYESYLYTAIWAECPDSRSEEDEDELKKELLPSTLKTMRNDCARFIERIGGAVREDLIDEAARMFWLTRQGHGDGFWAYPETWGNLTDKLTDVCKEFGKFHEVIFLDPSEAPAEQVLRAYGDYVRDFYNEHTEECDSEVYGTNRLWDGCWPDCVEEFKESEWFLNWLKKEEYEN